MDRVLRDADSGQGDGVGLTHQQLWQFETFEEDGILQDSVPEQVLHRAGRDVACARQEEETPNTFQEV
jgi:hypothetical protein